MYSSLAAAEAERRREIRRDCVQPAIGSSLAVVTCAASMPILESGAVTRAAATGGGPVDFKFSADYNVRILVETKLSTNGKLVNGYRRQLAAYQASEKPIHAIYLVLDVGGMGIKERRLIQARNDAGGTKSPVIKVVNGKRRPSASKL
jgi:hypothetical protein